VCQAPAKSRQTPRCGSSGSPQAVQLTCPRCTTRTNDFPNLYQAAHSPPRPRRHLLSPERVNEELKLGPRSASNLLEHAGAVDGAEVIVGVQRGNDRVRGSIRGSATAYHSGAEHGQVPHLPLEASPSELKTPQLGEGGGGRAASARSRLARPRQGQL
jgi:hypothetical protein